MSDIAYVALGSNLGDRAGQLARARARLAALPQTQLIAESSIDETEPIGPPGQGKYLNQLVALDTALSPRVLLDALLEIERLEGRQRRTRWEARTLDLDIVCFECATVSEPELTVPHPELPNRDFWQRELTEVRRAIHAIPPAR